MGPSLVWLRNDDFGVGFFGVEQIFAFFFLFDGVFRNLKPSSIRESGPFSCVVSKIMVFGVEFGGNFVVFLHFGYMV